MEDFPMQQKQAERETDPAPSSIRLPGLSPAAAAFVRKHPGQAQLAVMAALEAAATQFGALDRVKPTIPEQLRPFVIEPAAVIPPIGVIGADEAAQRLGVTRATIYNWIEAKRLIGWSLTRLGKMIPLEQIAGKGEVVAGIDRVLELIPEPRAAWRFLDEMSPQFDTPQRPIDALKAGKLDQVLNAARASGEAFT
jgi:excisionase family DNA binding protein